MLENRLLCCKRNKGLLTDIRLPMLEPLGKHHAQRRKRTISPIKVLGFIQAQETGRITRGMFIQVVVAEGKWVLCH